MQPSRYNEAKEAGGAFLKKIVLFLLLVSLVLTFAACSGDEISVDSTSSESDNSAEHHIHEEVIDQGKPATCEEDGLSDGKHCATCGEILQAQEIIPAVGHTMKEANYWEPAICSVCGYTEGEKLTPFYEDHKIPTITQSCEFDFKTCCDVNTSKYTIGNTTVTIDSGRVPENCIEAPEGYKWKNAEIRIRLSDKNFNKYGARLGQYTFMNSYYNGGIPTSPQNSIDIGEPFEITDLYRGEETKIYAVLEYFDYDETDAYNAIDAVIRMSVCCPDDYGAMIFAICGGEYEINEVINRLPDSLSEHPDEIILLRFA